MKSLKNKSIMNRILFLNVPREGANTANSSPQNVAEACIIQLRCSILP